MGSFIGLDVGSSAVRAVQVSTGRGAMTLERLGQVLLPAGAVRDGEIVDIDGVAESLRTLWSRYKLKGRRAALGLANQQVVVRQLDVPYMPDSELRQSLPFQVQDAIPIAVDQAILDFHTLEHFETEDGQRFSRILVVAAQREMVDRVLEAMKRAKLEPIGLDLDAFAILRALAPVGAIDSTDGELLIDLGANVTNIIVHEGGAPRFVRILLMGGNGLTDALVNGLGMTIDEAEAAKASYGNGAVDGEASRVIGERANRLVDEIRGSIDYYAAQADAVGIRRLVLSGGASQLPTLAEQLAETLHMEVVHGLPMQQLHVGKVGLDQYQLLEAQPYLSVAVGLAMGAAE